MISSWMPTVENLQLDFSSNRPLDETGSICLIGRLIEHSWITYSWTYFLASFVYFFREILPLFVILYAGNYSYYMWSLLVDNALVDMKFYD